jgi:hypothetical protein
MEITLGEGDLDGDSSDRIVARSTMGPAASSIERGR